MNLPLPITLRTRLSQALLEPHASIQDEEDYRRARFLAQILIVAIPLLSIPALAQAARTPHVLTFFGPAIILLCIAYALSRTRFFRLGIITTLLALTLLPIASILMHPDPDPEHALEALIWMLPGLVLSSLLLSPGGLVALFLAATGAMLALPLLKPVYSLSHITEPLGLNLATTILLFAVTVIRHRDLQKLKTRTQQADELNTFLHTVIDSLSDPLYIINVDDYSIQLANTAASEYGITPNLTCYALTHNRETPCEGLEHPCPLTRVKESKEAFVVEHTHYRPDGTPYYAEVRGFPILDENGEVVQMIEYSIDITHRKLADENIRKLSRGVEQSANAIIITDADGTIEYVNPAFTRITGYTAEEAIGQNPRMLKSGKMPAETYQALWATLLRGEVWQGEMINRKKNGELYWEWATISPVKDDQGRVTHYVAVKENITERKKMEAELIQARDQALAANRIKSQILANVSHDMRTPLGAIIGYADMLRQNIYGPVTEAQQEKLNAILQSSNQLMDFIRNLLGQAELAAGEVEIKQQHIAPQQLLDEVNAIAQVHAENKGLALNSEVDPRVPDYVISDSYWLQRILTNLVSNAIKFTSQGEVNIRIALTDDEQYWTLQVADTGPGIPEELHATIFEPFQKGDNTRSGAGLGLAIVHEVIEKMHGRIELESAPGQGSTFTVYLPLQPIEVTS